MPERSISVPGLSPLFPQVHSLYEKWTCLSGYYRGGWSVQFLSQKAFPDSSSGKASFRLTVSVSLTDKSMLLQLSEH